MTASSTSSFNDVNTANPVYEVSTVSPNINTACPQVSTANFSDNTLYTFMVENPNGSNLLQQDLEQIHEDDLEVIDFKWQLSLLSMRAKRECRAPRNKEGRFKYQDNTKKQGNNEDTSSKAVLAIDGVAATYKRGLETIEEQLITYRKNEVLFSEEVAVLKREVACKDYEINVLKKSQITDKSKKGLGYNVVPPPHPLIYNRPKKLDLSYSSLDEFKDLEFKSYGYEDSKQESNIVCDKKSDNSKENSNNSLVKEQVSEDTSNFVESSLNVDKETVFLVDKKIEFIKLKNHEKPVKKSVRTHLNAQRNMVPRTVLMKTGLKPFNTARTVNTAHLKSILPDESQILLKIPRKDNMYSFDMKNIVPKESLTCLVAKATSDKLMLWHRRLGYINFKNINKLVKDNLVRGLPTKRFENDQTCVACLKGKQYQASCKSKVLNLITKPLFMLHMDLFGPTFRRVIKGNTGGNKTPSKMVVCLRGDNLGKFDGKSDEGFFVGYSLSSKAFRWLFDIDSLTQSMNYVSVVAGTISNESTDDSYFDSPSNDAGNGEPKTAFDDQKQVEDGSHNESDEKDKSKDDSSPKEVNVAGQLVNTANLEVNTDRFKLNIVNPSVNIASLNDQDSPKDMFKLGASHTLEATHVEFFSDEDEPELDLGNITNSYVVLLGIMHS
ncbi:putative ribonuclease H-like domain-containing protein [Tanacetum coccineum]